MNAIWRPLSAFRVPHFREGSDAAALTVAVAAQGRARGSAMGQAHTVCGLLWWRLLPPGLSFACEPRFMAGSEHHGQEILLQEKPVPRTFVLHSCRCGGAASV